MHFGHTLITPTIWPNVIGVVRSGDIIKRRLTAEFISLAIVVRACKLKGKDFEANKSRVGLVSRLIEFLYQTIDIVYSFSRQRGSRLLLE